VLQVGENAVDSLDSAMKARDFKAALKKLDVTPSSRKASKKPQLGPSTDWVSQQCMCGNAGTWVIHYTNGGPDAGGDRKRRFEFFCEECKPW
jgi:hypothetical protein